MKQIFSIGFICNILIGCNLLAMKTYKILGLRQENLHREIKNDIDRKMESAAILFDQRNDKELLKKAQNIYEDIIKDSKAPLNERREAFERYGQLSLYVGAIARSHFAINNDEAAELFSSCMDNSKYLSPKKIKSHAAEYYYWRASCIGLYLVNISLAKAIIHANKFGEMKDLVDYGLEHFRAYENYGFNRIKAGLLYKTKDAPKILKLYNPNEAEILIDEAIEKGFDNYASHLMKAEILVELNNNNKALAWLEESILELNDRFANNNLPKELILENGWFLEGMHALKVKLSY